jgi:glycosyltransferase involved in cell wall biosynthesis
MVVDNNSSDNTADVVKELSQRSAIAISYFFEKKQGLSAARNRGLKESFGEYVGFLDDECVVRPDWLEIVAADIDEFAPAIIGGPYVGAFLPGSVPKWFKLEYGNAYFLSRRFSRGYQNEFRASGGNMVLRRDVVHGQQFDDRLGVKGNELKLGEEVVLQERYISANAGAAAFYEPRMEVAHYILPQKMTLSYHANRLMEFGAWHGEIKTAVMPLFIARSLAYLCISPLLLTFRDRCTYRYWQNYAYERVLPAIMPVFGAVSEKFRRRYR